MRKTLITISSILFLALFSSCSSYVSMNFHSTSFDRSFEEENLSVKYSLNFLHSHSSTASTFAKHADALNIQLMAVEIENEGIEPIELGKTHMMAVNGSPVSFIESESLYQSLKYQFRGFVPTLLLSPFVGLGALAEEGEEPPSPGVIITLACLGPVSLIGAAISQSADNANLKTDIERWNLFGKMIPAGKKQKGIIAIHSPRKEKQPTFQLFSIQRY